MDYLSLYSSMLVSRYFELIDATVIIHQEVPISAPCSPRCSVHAMGFAVVSGARCI